MKLVFRPVTADRWADFEALFGERGACGGCWCMWWRLKRAEFERQKGNGNRSAMRTLIESGEVPGILAYCGERPVAWCSVAPRHSFPVLGRSPILKPLDDQPVWSIVCFYVDRDYREQGVSVRLIEAAVDYARRQGAKIVEGYPVEPKKERIPAIFAFTGLPGAFLQVGFSERARRSPTRPFMRREL